MEREFVVRNRNGIHGRVAAMLAGIAARHDVIVHIFHHNKVIDCSSILDVLSMAFVYGTRFKISVTGREKEKAMVEIEKLFVKRTDL